MIVYGFGGGEKHGQGTSVDLEEEFLSSLGITKSSSDIVLLAISST